jgi:hypothetical protein
MGSAPVGSCRWLPRSAAGSLTSACIVNGSPVSSVELQPRRERVGLRAELARSARPARRAARDKRGERSVSAADWTIGCRRPRTSLSSPGAAGSLAAERGASGSASRPPAQTLVNNAEIL